MWPEAIVAVVGTAGASAAYLVHKARGYSGGYSQGDIDRTNARRGTETPKWNSPEFNRLGDPPSLPTPGPRPGWYDAVGTPPPAPHDWATARRAYEAEPDPSRRPFGWIAQDSPAREGNTEPPEYDGPRG